ncbi:transketolase [Nocardiopsis ansamitocini]|uniref:Transketolase n=1 Tax=Nocardiopsis ansamitocini TaxID=1670832 RepID=A0A9W6P422_9ACTN|nr:transketolase [Nocardiopsis ansamitocini]GLU46919.1 transketolase [Nocardiopsis ansamitocini]
MPATTLSRYADLPALVGLLTGNKKHQAAATTTLDVLWVLYDRVLDISPATATDPARDRFLLSRGHDPAAYYAVLAAKGFIDTAALRSWGEFDSPLGRRPDRTLVPGVEISGGSPGHGLGLGVGTALGLRAQGHGAARVVVLLGDTELDEGSSHEAITAAARLGLSALTAVVIDSRSSPLGRSGKIPDRFAREDWATRSAPGRDHDALHQALTAPHESRPLAVTVRTAARHPR